MPIGTLREALWFPARPTLGREAEARAALAAVGLSNLSHRLDEHAHWAQALSLGEQQRLAIARALLIKPDWLSSMRPPQRLMRRKRQRSIARSLMPCRQRP